MKRQQLRVAIEGPLLDLARAREYAIRTADIPAPRPASDFCPTCGGSLRHHPAWVTFSERCSSDWHDTTTERN